MLVGYKCWGHLEFLIASGCPHPLATAGRGVNVTRTIGRGHNPFNHFPVSGHIRHPTTCKVCYYMLRQFVPTFLKIVLFVYLRRRTTDLEGQA